jgi:hypothetical protein
VGVLAVGAAIFARFEHSLDAVGIAASGVIILATALALRPGNSTESQKMPFSRLKTASSAT